MAYYLRSSLRVQHAKRSLPHFRKLKKNSEHNIVKRPSGITKERSIFSPISAPSASQTQDTPKDIDLGCRLQKAGNGQMSISIVACFCL